jgi:DNA polymerase-3 subunit epsilon
VKPDDSDCFVALDFETADQGRDSACAIGIVRVEKGKIAAKEHRLIRPPRQEFLFTYIHGITWEDVAGEPTFREVWQDVQVLLDGVGFIAAHNASFDSGVLRACCQAAGISLPSQPFLCTVGLARRTWGIYPTKLPNVCEALKIKLKHHEALSDAEACARIVLAATKVGTRVQGKAGQSSLRSRSSL